RSSGSHFNTGRSGTPPLASLLLPRTILWKACRPGDDGSPPCPEAIGWQGMDLLISRPAREEGLMDILLITHDPDLKEYRNRALVERLEQAGVSIKALAPAALTFHWTRRQMVLLDRRGDPVEPRLVVNGLFRNEGEGI